MILLSPVPIRWGLECGLTRTEADMTGAVCAIRSDLTEPEWSLVKDLIPPGKRGGRWRTVDLRDVVNGLMYVLSTGCQWRAVPKDLPPRSPLHDYLSLWQWDGTLDRIHHALYVACREQAGHDASPTAAIIDSQSVKSAEKGGARIDPPGFDAGKKIKGKEASCAGRHPGPDAARHRARGRHPGSGWRSAAGRNLVQPASVPHQALRRCRIPRSPLCRRGEARNGPVERRDRQAVRVAPLRRATKAMAGRAHHRMAQSLPQAGQRTGRTKAATRSPSCASLPSASCSENYAIPHKPSGQTLRAEDFT